MNTLQHNIEVIKNKILDASKGKDDVTLIGVSKTIPWEKVLEATTYGLTNLGENRVQELVEKHEKICDSNINWHLIGQLQKNKVKKTSNCVKMVQSLDSVDLAEKMQSVYESNDVIMPVLLQVNIGNELQKSGVHPDNVFNVVSKLQNYKNISLNGLMAVPPNINICGQQALNNYFSQMNDIYKELKDMNLPYADIKYLSMGMTLDFEIAISNGANMVRVGSAIFGSRL